MRPEERDPAYLWDMIEAARAAVDYTENLTLNKFLATDRERAITRLAVERQLEILGEAARRVSSQFREAHPELPWREIVGLRNVISHEYDKVNYESIFRIVRNRLPVLIAMLEPLVPPLPMGE
ncbi:MAG: DUF86 domain-containing protein [Deltaproteobacteria bacterium]|jgi:uncharacterized protein with HEPN domain|nr:MAG: DUF86 domain-containing protein [Deltaproteobacteria bacterium]